MAKKKKIAVIDFETDPFLHGRIPIPFAWGFYDGEKYVEHWQPNAWDTPKVCAEVLVNFLLDISEEYLIYAHNGGKFDFLFFIEHLTGNIRIVNGRILQANLGAHLIRDSYAILPIPLSAAGDKLDIDYKLMERGVRENHKDEILHYQKQDCLALYKLVIAFREEFGDVLTIGSAAMKELKKFHPFQAGGESFDKSFRKFYFGGRCQCFETGVINNTIEGYDLNSSYPDTMKSKKHPIGLDQLISGKVGTNTAFVTWEGWNYGAVPIRVKTGLDFTCEYGVFNSTIHEFEAGLDTNTIKVKKIIEAIHFTQMGTFDDFIDHFYGKRLASAASFELLKVIFYKLILNSAYGKFAQSPDNFEDCIILPWGDIPPLLLKPNGIAQEIQYEIKHSSDAHAIWARPSNKKTYFNVATAASITGGSRATLLRGLSQATRPYYCDTDSIYCESFAGNVDKKQLGAWKHEFTGSQIAIAGKKLYAVMGDKMNKETGEMEYGCLKKASKGTMLNAMAIFMIARGDTCETKNDAPAFKLDGKHQFIHRNIRKTTI